MTARDGYTDRLDGLKYEEQLAKTLNTKVVGRSGGKQDLPGISVKTSSSASTQVHLTTINKLKELFGIDESGLFTKWLGESPTSSTVRFALKSFSKSEQDLMLNELNSCKESLAEVILGARDVDCVHWHDKSTNKVAVKSVQKLLSLVDESNWCVGKRFGSFTLTHPIIGIIFHLQRKGSGAVKNQPLFHLHKGAIFA
jgi:hypothetical protein